MKEQSRLRKIGKWVMYFFGILLLVVAGVYVAYRLRGRLKMTSPETEAELAERLERHQISPEALQALIDAGKASHSDAIVVYKDGELIGAWHVNGKPKILETMSVTKSVVNLAVGLAITQGYIESLDTPMYTFFPEWAEGPKSKITLRHVLSHTSGLFTEPMGKYVYEADDSVRQALDAELVDEPGTVFFYNNSAVSLLPAVVEITTGKRMDLYLADELFAPMGIVDFNWGLDKAGNPYGMADFQVHPESLAKLGQLVLDKGQFQGQQLIDASWFDVSLAPGAEFTPQHGLLWWIGRDVTYVLDDARLEELRRIGVSEEALEKLEKAKGRYQSQSEFIKAMVAAFGNPFKAQSVRLELAKFRITYPDRREYGDTVYSYKADGYLGQYIYINSDKNLVGVRMVSQSMLYNSSKDGFEDFSTKMSALVE